MMQIKRVILTLLTAALAVCLLCGFATAESAAPTVDELVQQGCDLAALDADGLQALLAQAAAAKADASAEDTVRLENLEAAIAAAQEARAAAENGTLEEYAKAQQREGTANSWRYQNGELAVYDSGESSDISLATYEADGTRHFGIDVSYSQGVIDWDAVKAAGVEFAIIRCGYGSEWDGYGEYNQDDEYWERNVSECERLGIPYGVYLFSYAVTPDMARSEASHTLRLLNGRKPQLPIFYDIEANAQQYLSAETLGEIAQTWCDELQDAGYTVGIYANQTWFARYLTADNFNNNSWYRWVAAWLEESRLTYTGRMDAWQYDNYGYINGISGRVDLDYWYGELSVNNGGSSGSGTVTPTTPYTPSDATGSGTFVTRLYQTCLGRTPDADGLAYWVNQLTSGQASGSSVASGFIFSQEFKNYNYCNEHYATQLYRAFLGREPDTAGLSYWVSQLEGGKTREEVFNGFVSSTEFSNLCTSTGVTCGSPMAVPQYGTVPTGPCTVCGKQDNVTLFVSRLYLVCLGREPEAAGLTYWTNRLWAHTNSGRDVAHGFIFSDEFTNKGYSDADFLEHLYEAFMGRASDSAGKAYWLARMAQGSTRLEVFGGFVESEEFTVICNRYGIVRG